MPLGAVRTVLDDVEAEVVWVVVLVAAVVVLEVVVLEVVVLAVVVEVLVVLEVDVATAGAAGFEVQSVLVVVTVPPFPPVPRASV